MKDLADRVIDRLMEAYDVGDEGALALQLGREESTFRVWRSRDLVPLAILVEASRATGYSIDWLGCKPDAKKSASTKTPADDRKKARATSTAEEFHLTERELALLKNYRATSEEGRRALELAGSALAKPHAKVKAA